jgi:hypothetical protein
VNFNEASPVPRRRQPQHAADGEYPFTDPANAGMRRKLDLPALGPPVESVKEKQHETICRKRTQSSQKGWPGRPACPFGRPAQKRRFTK